ncbi:MAG TPA: hypothetical protein VF163_00635 [Micromonosporaceae bacterium]
MSRVRMLARLTAVGATVAALTLPTASPAAAGDGDIDVNLSGLSSSLTAGGNGDSFSVRMQNQTGNEFIVRRVFIVKLPGLTAEQVQISRGAPLPKESPSPGEVRFLDIFGVRLNADGKRGDSVSNNFQIRFGEGAPAGEARVIAEAYVGQDFSGRDSDTVRIRSDVTAQPSEAPTSAPATVAPSTVVAQPSSLAPVVPAAAPDEDRGGGVPVILYVMGAILVSMGGAILWLLLRPRPATAGAPDLTGAGRPYQPSRATTYPTQVFTPGAGGPGGPGGPIGPGGPGGPGGPPTGPGGRPLHPTTVMPPVREPYPSVPPTPPAGGPNLPPPFDPWADPRGGPPDSTRDLGPYRPRP